MAKTRRTVVANLPGYRRQRYEWRREIFRRVREVQHRRRVEYEPDGQFEVVVLLYLTKGKRHDVLGGAAVAAVLRPEVAVNVAAIL
jgi:hypothetical protein